MSDQLPAVIRSNAPANADTNLVARVIETDSNP